MNPSRVWSHLRAALVLFALVGSCVEGLPVPRTDASYMERAVGRRELTRWRGVLRGAGIDVSEEELRDRVLEVSEELGRVHARLRAPVAPFFELTRTLQRWSLFPIADPTAYWMHVEGRVDGEWALLYRPNDPAHRLLAERIEYRRVRAVWNPGSRGMRPDYPRFVDWVAREIFALRGDIDAVRVRHLRYQVSPPSEPPSSEQSWVFEEVRTRAEREAPR